MGLVPRSRGAVELAGADVTRLPTHAVVRRGVGYVPEDRDVFAGLTVEENLRLAERDDDPRYELVYDLFPELRQRAAQRAGTLSGGQQQMVAIARALLNENQVLLVDEPTKGLAPLLVTEVAAALERAAELTTILLVEQNLPVVQRLARDVVVLDAGQRRPRRPGGRAARRPRAHPAAARRPRRRRIEHLRPAHDHGPRSRRDVLPRRLRAVADLRPDGRAQLRARRVHHRRAPTPRGGSATRSAAGSGRGCSSAARSGSSPAPIVAALIELVFIRPLYRRPIEQVLVTVGLALALGALVQGIWGHDPKPFPVPDWMIDTTTILGANVPNDRFVEIGVAAAVLARADGVPPLHALRPRDPRRRREPGDGECARDRRAPRVHDRVRPRRRARGARRCALGRLLRHRRPGPRDVAPHLRLHRRRDRRLRLDRRLGGRRGRGRADPAVRELLRLAPAPATSPSCCCSPPCSSSGPAGSPRRWRIETRAPASGSPSLSWCCSRSSRSSRSTSRSSSTGRSTAPGRSSSSRSASSSRASRSRTTCSSASRACSRSVTRSTSRSAST